MTSMDSRTMNRLVKRPQDMMRCQMTGRLPRTKIPDSPLIRLLESIPPRERVHYRGVMISPELGYRGGFRFRDAEALLRWLKPSDRMFADEHFPAESRQIVGFNKRLTVEDLKAACAQVPQ